MRDDEKRTDGKDMVVIAGPEGPGGWIPCVRHRPDHTMTIGAIKPMKDGDTVNVGEIVSVKEGDGPVREVETVWSSSQDHEPGPGPTPTCGKGPIMVNSQACGDGWDRIFDGKQKAGGA